MAWTTPNDVTDRWVGEDVPDNLNVIGKLIDDAESLIRYEFPDIEDRINSTDPGGVPLERIIYVVCSMVTRVLRNPDGLRQEGMTGWSATYAGEQPGTLHISDTERAMLTGLPGAPKQKAFTIDPTPAAATSVLQNAWVNGPYGYAPGEA